MTTAFNATEPRDWIDQVERCKAGEAAVGDRFFAPGGVGEIVRAIPPGETLILGAFLYYDGSAELFELPGSRFTERGQSIPSRGWSADLRPAVDAEIGILDVLRGPDWLIEIRHPVDGTRVNPDSIRARRDTERLLRGVASSEWRLTGSGRKGHESSAIRLHADLIARTGIGGFGLFAPTASGIKSKIQRRLVDRERRRYGERTHSDAMTGARTHSTRFPLSLDTAPGAHCGGLSAADLVADDEERRLQLSRIAEVEATLSGFEADVFRWIVTRENRAERGATRPHWKPSLRDVAASLGKSHEAVRQAERRILARFSD